MPYGVMNSYDVNTSNGINHPMSPPGGWAGQSSEEYKALIRARYYSKGIDEQQINVIAYRMKFGFVNGLNPIRFSGPWADEAKEILTKIGNTFVPESEAA